MGKHRDEVSYVFFGVLTTVVDWVVSFVCYYWLNFSETSSTAIAWFLAVIFAYLTNKVWVFNSREWSIKIVAPEVLKFFSGRVFSGLLVIGLIKVTVGILNWNYALMKVLSSILNLVLNYIFSKLLVFHKS